ncbi:MAG: adenosylcobinamide amidohydrolase [Clostridia bacterium]
MMILHKFENGDEVHTYSKAIVCTLNGKRKVLSTGPNNGGYSEHLTAVFNQDGKPGSGMACTLKAPTYEEHQNLIAEELGLEPSKTTGLGTAADMKNVAIVTKEYKMMSVTAVVTGGIETNGGRVGDPATWYEEMGKGSDIKLGTINIMLFINADLTKGALTRALVTCTEAKTAAIQELLAPSRYSMGLATGSGTDGTIIVANSESENKLTNSGKHSKLGELIGLAVKQAVTETLDKQSALNKKTQHNVLRRMDRFGITQENFWAEYKAQEGDLNKAQFVDKLYNFTTSDEVLTYSSLYAHLLDQLMWDLISIKETMFASNSVLGMITKQHLSLPDYKATMAKEEAIDFIIKRYLEICTSFFINKNKTKEENK